MLDETTPAIADAEGIERSAAADGIARVGASATAEGIARVGANAAGEEW